MANVRRIFVEKKAGFDVEAQGLWQDLKNNLGIVGLHSLRIVIRYDIEGISEEDYLKARPVIFAEPPVDWVYDENMVLGPQCQVLALEYLPGQYDQRADSAAQCLQILTHGEPPLVRAARLLVMEGELSRADLRKIQDYCLNPLESRLADLGKPQTLDMEVETPPDVEILRGFVEADAPAREVLRRELGLAMSAADLEFCQGYFRDTEKRDPSLTEIRVLDTYWSDHCRHTTFLSRIEEIEMADSPFLKTLRASYQDYLECRRRVYGSQDRDVSLMSLATIAGKELAKRGLLEDLDASEEINACSIRVEAEVDGHREPWLVMFKNETHNHPTEIEPFGGAATCLGGAIRDPLSGRSYVYHAMRVTGSGDPRTPIEETLPGKLPQSKITRVAAAGFSSYGNQIGLATGQVAEIYDPGYVAKRLEIGAVIGAAPQSQVVRIRPEPGDAVVLLGGRTGRDGCGGATGSSKAHTEHSLQTCGSEVQKGNPPTERKLQRLFRSAEISRMIKRCNDFGAGGVSVAIGELTDGLDIQLDVVPKKYEGLDGTELAISESQERMAVVVSPENLPAFLAAAGAENLEGTVVARVTADARLKMHWRGQTIVNLRRAFLNSNGVQQTARVQVTSPDPTQNYFKQLPAAVLGALGTNDLAGAWLANLEQLNVCGQKGLVERFDSTIGAASVLLPFGGCHQLTPVEAMAAKLPVLKGETRTATLMAHGYNPQIARWSPFHGAIYALVEAVAKITATGGDYRSVRLSLQEYFEKLGQNPQSWGKPFAALLGAFHAQMQMGIPAIGGKDSMSGTFRDLNVPPTLVAFALCPVDAAQVISPEFKQPGNPVLMIPLPRDEEEIPVFEVLRGNYEVVHRWIKEGKVVSARSIRLGGLAEALSKMCFGNGIGFEFEVPISAQDLFSPDYGALVLEISTEVDLGVLSQQHQFHFLGKTSSAPLIRVNGIEIALSQALKFWMTPLEKIFPSRSVEPAGRPEVYSYDRPNRNKPRLRLARPRVFIPVFPGTNCEVDSARAFHRAGAIVDLQVLRNLSAADIDESMDAMAHGIDQAQIIMLPGGFSAGDEPEGSGKFIGAVFRNPRIKEAVTRLLQQRDGLMLGICNGFQAFIKLGLVPYGEIRDLGTEDPTLTFNTIGRHVSCMVQTRVASTLSPWLSKRKVGDLHAIAISHGEGRFVANPDVLENLRSNGQIATQYVDLGGNPTYDSRYNPNGSVESIEGITSPDGRVLGKMGHSERIGKFVAKNIPGEKDQQIFEAGVEYFF